MRIAIIDNGSQYTHLIKRNCRDLDHEGTIINNKDSGSLNSVLSDFDKIIISGGTDSVYKKDLGLSGTIVDKIKEGKEIPLLGICFGHQLIGYKFGAKVEKGKSAEYGFGSVEVDIQGRLLSGMPKKFKVWVSHYDEVKEVPDNFVKLAHSDSCNVEAMEHKTRKIFSVQFHPEVWHTEHGEEILKNFLDV